MSKIRIKNFGPIKEGFKDADGNEWMDINKVTVFIGNQGSGKSTVAKLISTLTWLEKAMVKGEIRDGWLNTHNRFKKHCAYQQIHNYFKENTQIGFQGNAFTFSYSNGTFEANRNNNNGYLLPKIMYVPAERNFVSAVDRPDKLKNLPRPLVTFLDEYEKAKDNIGKEGIELPINNTTFEYDKANKIAHIKGKDESYRLRLSEASSGFQSTVPLYLVSWNLANLLNREEDPSKRELSSEEQKKLQAEVLKIVIDESLSEDVKQAYLRAISGKYKVGCFINIVEEPEQNLFPTSQRQILFSLLKYANLASGNGLVLTTHSPYIINYLTLAVKANSLKGKIKTEELRKKLNNIVLLDSTIESSELVIYELDTKGNIIKLGTYNGLPSDENYLNEKMSESNELYAQLLEIQQML